MLIVFYDGDCGLCDAAVQFLLKIDRNRILHFAPLQGSTAKEHLAELRQAVPDLDSLVLSDHGTLQVKATAVLRTLWLIGGLWAFLGWMYVLPAAPLNWAYDCIARNRHRFFTKDPFCQIPDAETRKRFLP